MPRDRRTFDFDIELLSCCTVTGTFTAEDGGVTHVELEDGTEFRTGELRTYASFGSTKSNVRFAIAKEVLRQIEESEFYKDLTAQTASEDEEYDTPIRIGHRGMATV